MKIQTKEAAMKSSIPKTQLPPSAQLRKVVFRGALLALALLALALAPPVRAQQIYTTPYDFTSFTGLSGGGYVDSTGLFSGPWAAAVDSAGNVYVADSGNDVIRKIDTAGNITLLAGSPDVTGFTDGYQYYARLNYPTGVALDSAGNLYVVDEGNAAIRKIDAGGNVTTLAGNGTSGYVDGPGSSAEFSAPIGIAVDSAGNLYVADQGNQVIRKIDTAENVTTLAGQPGTLGSANGNGSAAQFKYPCGMAIDSAGNLYVADQENYAIRKIDTAANVTTYAGNGTQGFANGPGSTAEFSYLLGVAVDSAGNVYVPDGYNHLIRKIDTAQNVTTLGGQLGVEGSGLGNGNVSAAYFGNPRGAAVDSAGNLYVMDVVNETIQEISTAGTVTTIGGTPRWAGYLNNGARFSNPTGGAIDSAGNIYVADYNNCLIRKIDTTGKVITWAGYGGGNVVGSGNGNGCQATFYLPTGVAVDSAGNVYVADQDNALIRKIDPLQNVTTYAGNGTAGYVDGPGSSAEFNSPAGVAVDTAGNVYVADTYNSVIRKIDTAQNVTTYAGSDAYGPGNEGNGQGVNSYFSYPQNLAADSAGNLYVADIIGATIRKIDTAVNVTTIGGTAYYSGYTDGPSSGSYFSHPSGVSADNAGNVYVADAGNNAIRRIDTAGNVSTLAGGPTAGSAFGIGSAAQFNNPADVSVDSAGNLWVVDQYNERISEGYSSIAPTLVSATRSYLNATLVTVVLSEQVSAATATTVANYSLNDGTAIYGATLSADGMTVTLTTSPIFNNVSHILTVNNVQAANAGALTIANGSQITISLPNDTIFQEYNLAPGNDVLVLEAEDYDLNTPGGGDSWVFTTTPSLLLPTSGNTTYSGTGTMQALPSNGRNIGTVALGTTPANTPCMSYSVLFTNTGTFYVWVRGVGDAGGPNLHRSVYIGLDNVLAAGVGSTDFANGGGYLWGDDGWPTSAYEPMTVSSTGFHTINVYMRQDGFTVDKLLLTDDSSYTPANLGPAESPTSGSGPMSGPAMMVTQSGGSTVLWWDNGGTLQSSTSISGPFADIAGTSPFTVVPAAGPPEFYRVRW
jgi:sugar lactone lactonase YvrE